MQFLALLIFQQVRSTLNKIMKSLFKINLAKYQNTNYKPVNPPCFWKSLLSVLYWWQIQYNQYLPCLSFWALSTLFSVHAHMWIMHVYTGTHVHVCLHHECGGLRMMSVVLLYHLVRKNNDLDLWYHCKANLYKKTFKYQIF